MSCASLRVRRLISGGRCSVGGVPGGQPSRSFTTSRPRRSGSRPLTDLRVRIFPLRQRGLKGQGSPTLRSRRPDLSWAPGRGRRGGVLRNIGNRSISRAWWRMSQYSGVRGRRMPANSSSNLLSCNVGQSPSTPFFFLFLVNVPKAFPLPNTCGLIFREARKS